MTARAIVLLIAVILLLGGCHKELAPPAPKPPPPAAVTVRKHTIWPRLESLPAIESWSMYTICEGRREVRRFFTPGRGQLLSGAFYAVASDKMERDVLVSLYADNNGQFDWHSRLASQLVTARVPETAAFGMQQNTHAYPVQFSIRCNLSQGSYWCLVVEPGWSNPRATVPEWRGPLEHDPVWRRHDRRSWRPCRDGYVRLLGTDEAPPRGIMLELDLLDLRPIMR